ncbi:MAG: pyruvate formate lyase family protein [Acutalibacteraceae bacterium]|nr:pyruvate formate lyase family protein [Acutalibacteraceae bacterium]
MSRDVICDEFKKVGEFFAAGFFEEPSKSMFSRFSRAVRRYFEKCRLNGYGGEPLYPCGSKFTGMLVFPDYSFTVAVEWEKLREKCPEATDKLAEELTKFKLFTPAEHTVGGNLYTHSYPNFKRIIKEGLDGYEERVRRIETEDIREGLLDVIAGIRVYHSRILEKLKFEAPDSQLYYALLNVPFKPAKTLYEALVCLNFIYYIDGCDNIGRPDSDLIEYFRGEDVTEVLRCFFKNVDDNNGWSGALGPNYNPLTIQCLKASKGLRRPSVELRITPNMPDEVWEAAIDSIKAGGGSPSLYNEQAYQNNLIKLFPSIPKSDLLCFAGGGCTETMLAGISNVGSLDAGINLALIFEKFMREHLSEYSNFEKFYEAFIFECNITIGEVLDAVSKSQKNREQFRPNPIRTLFIDDCIERGKDFNGGGARYYWSEINLAGMINVLDSLSTINKIVFDDGKMTAEEFLQVLSSGETFKNYRDIPRHGTNNTQSDDLARRLSQDICKAFEQKTPYLGGKFLPSSIQFITYVSAGKNVGATPDGRRAGEPLCDSIGAIHNNDDKGITALLGSAAALAQSEMAGTPVLNLKLSNETLSASLKPLVLGYFEKGGMQLQITCTNKDELLDAAEHPEKHPNLIVRVGGYSEYFGRLTDELRRTVIERTLYQ